MSKPCAPHCWLRSYRPPIRPTLSVRGDVSNDYKPVKTVLPQHIYTPVGSSHVRLLALHPGSDADPIVTTLHPSVLVATGAVPLDSPTGERVDYEALSYSWGYVGTTVDIYVNQVPVKVLRSLAVALQALREPYGVRYLWVDALCINQGDDEEKSREIQKMFRIYYGCVRCLVWLGVEVGDGMGVEEKAMVFLGEFDHEVVHQTECAVGLAAVCYGMGLLAARPWWERTWVRQEVFASKEVIVRAGDVYMPLSKLKANTSGALKVVEAFKTAHGVYAERFDVSGPSALIESLKRFQTARPQDAALLASGVDKQQLEKNVLWSLDRMLRNSALFKATDPKDFVYGIVSMTATKTFTRTDNNPSRPLLPPRPGVVEADSSSIQLPISYQSSLAQVFADTTEYVMKFHRSLDCMFLACYTEKTDRSLPSWVPRWSRLAKDLPIDKLWAVMDNLVRRDGGYWYYVPETRNGRNPTETQPAEKARVVLGGRQCSRFSNLRALMYPPAQFQMVSDESGIRLRCTGTLIGTLTEKRSFTASDHMSHGLHAFFGDYWTRMKYARRFMDEAIGQPSTHKPVSIEATTSMPPKNFEYPPTSRRDKTSANPLGTEELESTHVATSFVRRTLTMDVNGCFAPIESHEGDLVVLFRGSTLPAVLRQIGGGAQLVSLIGYLYCAEYVLEEAFRAWDAYKEMVRRDKPSKYTPSWHGFGPMKEDLPTQEFVIV